MSDDPIQLRLRWQSRPFLDIRAALLAGEARHVPRDESGHLDLRGIDLRRVTIHRFAIENAALDYAQLDGSCLEQAHITQSSLRFVSAVEGRWSLAALHDCDLSGSNLGGVTLAEGSLARCFLTGATFAGADLRAVDLHGAHLRACDLSAAWLSGANLDRDQRRRNPRRHLHSSNATLAELFDHLWPLEFLQPHSLRTARLVEGAAWASTSFDFDIIAGFNATDWRAHCASAALIVLGADRLRATRNVLDSCWAALPNCWASPQLAVAAFLLDPMFVLRAHRLLSEGCDPKCDSALRFLLGQESPDGGGGARIAAQWLARIREFASARCRAAWAHRVDVLPSAIKPGRFRWFPF